MWGGGGVEGCGGDTHCALSHRVWGVCVGGRGGTLLPPGHVRFGCAARKQSSTTSTPPHPPQCSGRPSTPHVSPSTGGPLGWHTGQDKNGMLTLLLM